MRIITIIGARPQFIKAAVVSREIRRRVERRNDAGIEELLIHTGQHFDENMSDVFFREMDIPKPSHHLGIGGGSHGQMTGRMLEAIERIAIDAAPDWMLVYGDTNSTIAGALAAAKLHIPVAHVEAGLRSFNRRMPEEINRVLTDHISALLFAPTEAAVANLLREGIPSERIARVGDVMYDAMLFHAERARTSSRVLETLGLESKRFILATVHRAENTDDPARLRGILEGLARLTAIAPVVLPLHPRTRKTLAAPGLIEQDTTRLRLIDPVGYLDMVMLEAHAGLIATDSGGVQKEAFFHRVPCITLRDETEWVELVECGANHLVGSDAERIAEHGAARFGRTVEADDLYGRGDAAGRIVDELLVRSPSAAVEATSSGRG